MPWTSGRYSDILEEYLNSTGGFAIWGFSEGDYSGQVDVVAVWPDGRFARFGWWWGSCEICDGWSNLKDEQILEEMLAESVSLGSKEEALRYIENCEPADCVAAVKLWAGAEVIGEEVCLKIRRGREIMDELKEELADVWIIVDQDAHGVQISRLVQK